MGERKRDQDPQPGDRIVAAARRTPQCSQDRNEAVADSLQPQQIQKQKESEPDGNKPRLGRLQRGELIGRAVIAF